MLRKFGTLTFVCALALGNGGCSQKLPLEEAGSAADADYSELSAPLDLRHFEVVSSAGGFRGVFLRLSRFPDSIEANHYSDPARIVLDIKGPTEVAGAEESFPGGDQVVSMVHVSRDVGQLRVVLDLVGSDPPAYSVHRMADWIMIRLRPPA